MVPACLLSKLGGRKIPLLPTQNPGKRLLLTPPPFTPKHKPTSRVQCMPCVQANMEAIAGILLCIVPIIQSHMSKWYSTTKAPKYAQ